MIISFLIHTKNHLQYPLFTQISTSGDICHLYFYLHRKGGLCFPLHGSQGCVEGSQQNPQLGAVANIPLFLSGMAPAALCPAWKIRRGSKIREVKNPLSVPRHWIWFICLCKSDPQALRLQKPGVSAFQVHRAMPPIREIQWRGDLPKESLFLG